MQGRDEILPTVGVVPGIDVFYNYCEPVDHGRVVLVYVCQHKAEPRNRAE